VFTGLVQTMGTVSASDCGRLTVETERPLDLTEGGSVAVSGVCLTATRVGDSGFDAETVDATLQRTSLGGLRARDTVNIELPLRAGEPFGGHMVQGHVDGVGTVDAVTEESVGRSVRISAGPDILRYVVDKGSITVDGVSLTVAAVGEDFFSVALIPETLERTTLGAATAGAPVNLEVDVLAKYVEKLVTRGAHAA
jgi:riboflavin synthase